MNRPLLAAGTALLTAEKPVTMVGNKVRITGNKVNTTGKIRKGAEKPLIFTGKIGISAGKTCWWAGRIRMMAGKSWRLTRITGNTQGSFIKCTQGRKVTQCQSKMHYC